jgi:hypothetical protein
MLDSIFKYTCMGPDNQLTSTVVAVNVLHSIHQPIRMSFSTMTRTNFSIQVPLPGKQIVTFLAVRLRIDGHRGQNGDSPEDTV